jgi:hypothetical protein
MHAVNQWTVTVQVTRERTSRQEPTGPAKQPFVRPQRVTNPRSVHQSRSMFTHFNKTTKLGRITGAFGCAYRSISSSQFIRLTFILHHTVLKPEDLTQPKMVSTQRRICRGKIGWRHWPSDANASSLAQVIASGNPSPMLHMMLPRLR